MAKKDKGPGCLMYFFFIFALAILGVCFFISNLLDFKTLLAYGPSQYGANIIHFHKDYYCRAESPLKIYGHVMSADSMAEPKEEGVVGTIPIGGIFKLKGYRTKEYVTWVAAKIAKGPDIVYGYFMVPEKISIPTFWSAVNRLSEMILDAPPEPFRNDYFSQISSDFTEKCRDSLRERLKTKLSEAVKLKTATDPAEMQKVKESKEFKIIDGISSDNVVYYCRARDYGTAERLYEAYLGHGFDTDYLQISDNYDPSANAVSREGLMLRIVDKWYFKLFAAIVFLFLLRLLFRRTGRE